MVIFFPLGYIAVVMRVDFNRWRAGRGVMREPPGSNRRERVSSERACSSAKLPLPEAIRPYL